MISIRCIVRRFQSRAYFSTHIDNMQNLIQRLLSSEHLEIAHLPLWDVDKLPVRVLLQDSLGIWFQYMQIDYL